MWVRTCRASVMNPDLYLKYAKQLVEQGDAYYCFCDKETTGFAEDVLYQKYGTEIVVYDKHCLHLC